MPDSYTPGVRALGQRRIPPLAERFLAPPGFVWGSFPTADGAVLRWGYLAADNPRAASSWQTASPILREWMRERLSVRQVLKDLRRQLPEIIEVARTMPTLLKGAVQRAKGGRLQMEVTSADLEATRAAQGVGVNGLRLEDRTG